MQQYKQVLYYRFTEMLRCSLVPFCATYMALKGGLKEHLYFINIGVKKDELIKFRVHILYLVVSYNIIISALNYIFKIEFTGLVKSPHHSPSRRLS